MVPVRAAVSLNQNQLTVSEIEFYREMDQLDAQAQKEKEFLTRAVGLDENQISLLSKKRENYLKQLSYFDQMQSQGIKEAQIYRDNYIQSHIQWMIQLMGTDNYVNYLNMSVQE